MLWVLIRIASTSVSKTYGSCKQYYHTICTLPVDQGAVVQSTVNLMRLCLDEAILMSTHNIGFYEEISKIIT